MVMHKHELSESCAYPYGFDPEVDSWQEVAEDRDSDVLVSISVEALGLSKYLNQSVDLAGELIIEDFVSSLLGFSLSSGSNSLVRLSPIISTVGYVQTLNVVSTGSNRRSLDRWSKEAMLEIKSLLGEGVEFTSNSALRVASPLSTQKQFRSEDLYQYNWYRKSASENNLNLLSCLIFY
ncbi:hypothetical protein AYI68_g3288 [Smittium mucronatum]|uniref:Uncharacterized protein n=1 Tax=Smittium mucronatum TaxID=133383 RepID=A0A1R0H0C6_9FUNG|nr:hypothetical protein AYI68_g3288 [Smittium mucronatum]